MIVGHGSRLRHFQKAMQQLARDLNKDKRFKAVYCCYLEITAPSVPAAISTCVKDGAEEILILPYFLLMGNHVKSDIPNLVRAAQNQYRSRAKIKLSPYLGYDPKILAVVKRRLKEAR